MISVDDTVAVKMPDGSGKAFYHEGSEEGAAQSSSVKKHTFLKRGEKTRKVYDPQRAVMMDKMARRNHSVA